MGVAGGEGFAAGLEKKKAKLTLRLLMVWVGRGSLFDQLAADGFLGGVEADAEVGGIVGAEAILDEEQLRGLVADAQAGRYLIGNRAEAVQVEVVRLDAIEAGIGPLALETGFGRGADGAGGGVLEDGNRLAGRLIQQGVELFSRGKGMPEHLKMKK